MESSKLENVDSTKRKDIKTLAKLGVSACIAAKAPFVFARNKTKIRVLGTHVTLQEELRQKAMADLGIELAFEPKGSAAVLQKASISPQSFDLYEQWSNSINVLWRSGSIQAIETNRVKHWDEINNLTKSGKLTPEANYGAGDAPYKILNVQNDDELGTTPTGRVSFLPYVHNVDSFGYNTNVIPQGVPYETESWGWLLDKKYSGKVGIVKNDLSARHHEVNGIIGVFNSIATGQSGHTVFDLTDMRVDRHQGEANPSGHLSNTDRHRAGRHNVAFSSLPRLPKHQRRTNQQHRQHSGQCHQAKPKPGGEITKL